jgi:hypothetical protein
VEIQASNKVLLGCINPPWNRGEKPVEAISEGETAVTITMTWAANPAIRAY